MKQTILSLLAVLALTASYTQAQTVDDFSGGGWREFSSTPGELSVEQGKMRLVDAPGEPEWMTVSKTFAVDFDKTPFFLVKVSDVSDRGTVKLIRKEPYDKKTAINIDRPGLYAIDMRSQFGWSGVGAVETCLYANGDEEEITYEYVKFAAKLSQEEEALIKARANDGERQVARRGLRSRSPVQRLLLLSAGPQAGRGARDLPQEGR